MLSIASIVSLGIYSVKAAKFKTEPDFATYSKESAILINNVMLSAALTAVLLGTLYPMIIELLGLKSISVGPPYFNLTFSPIMLAAVFMAGASPFIKWHRDKFSNHYKLFIVMIVISLILSVLINRFTDVYAIITITAGIWMLFASTWSYYKKSGRKFRLLPNEIIGMHLAHFGLGVAVLGIAFSTFYAASTEKKLDIGETANLAGYTFTYKAHRQVQAGDYLALIADFKVESDIVPPDNFHKEVFEMQVEKRFYTVQQSMTSEASINSNILRDVYIVIGNVEKTGAITARLYVVPLVSLLWFGAIIMVIGGALCIPFPARKKN